MNRIVTAKEGITLSNGMHLPYNTLISSAITPQHMDPALFPNPEEFNPRRFLDRDSIKLGSVSKAAFTATSPEYLFFGLGSHACPGRFFAANEIKTMIIFLLGQYDVRLPPGTKRPENMRRGESQMPNVMAQLEVRLKPKAERLVFWE
jgi:cytochrome P450